MAPPPISTSTSPLQVYPPFLEKKFVPPPLQVTQFSEGYTPPPLREGVPTLLNPNDAMVVVLKDIILCLLGFRFIYTVYIS